MWYIDDIPKIYTKKMCTGSKKKVLCKRYYKLNGFEIEDLTPAIKSNVWRSRVKFSCRNSTIFIYTHVEPSVSMGGKAAVKLVYRLKTIRRLITNNGSTTDLKYRGNGYQTVAKEHKIFGNEEECHIGRFWYLWGRWCAVMVILVHYMEMIVILVYWINNIIIANLR
jgi:hypothetical protein